MAASRGWLGLGWGVQGIGRRGVGSLDAQPGNAVGTSALRSSWERAGAPERTKAASVGSWGSDGVGRAGSELRCQWYSGVL